MRTENFKVCKNCAHAWKRDHHDLLYYGNRGNAYECCIASEKSEANIYRRLDDSCENFKQK